MPAIEVRNLRKTYRDKVAVDDVSFSVEPGEIFGILGPNGAGKTTTVECVQGLRVPDSGSINVLGFDPRRDRDQIRLRLGSQLQDSGLPDKLRVREALDLYSSFYPDPADWQPLVQGLGLADRLKARYGKLSGGQKQRLSIALALIGRPQIAVLDELTTGLDPQARRDTWALIAGIRERGVTVLLVTHFMDEAERLCDRVAVIDSGRVVAVDSPAGLTERVAAAQQIQFRPSVPMDDRLLSGLPEVTSIARDGDRVIVTGTGNLLMAVSTVLARNGIVAEHLRLEQANLEDAFVALTTHASPASDRSGASTPEDPTSPEGAGR